MTKEDALRWFLSLDKDAIITHEPYNLFSHTEQEKYCVLTQEEMLEYEHETFESCYFDPLKEEIVELLLNAHKEYVEFTDGKIHTKSEKWVHLGKDNNYYVHRSYYDDIMEISKVMFKDSSEVFNKLYKDNFIDGSMDKYTLQDGYYIGAE